jgi:hypothetical protein
LTPKARATTWLDWDQIAAIPAEPMRRGTSALRPLDRHVASRLAMTISIGPGALLFIPFAIAHAV